ncbi:unnamed protein product [Cuscuta campestris]|uniref:Uncharacterized protein n=1 Tax=Cuscuta campestris TaxID=132261 RepID=A0A484N8L1_9ASTE|nr:unnamed protein product [Cuscuta campestris]
MSMKFSRFKKRKLKSNCCSKTTIATSENFQYQTTYLPLKSEGQHREQGSAFKKEWNPVTGDLLLVEIEIFWFPNCTVDADDGNPHHQGRSSGSRSKAEGFPVATHLPCRDILIKQFQFLDNEVGSLAIGL